MFGYLEKHGTSTMVFDDTEPSFDSTRFDKCDWSEFYMDATEAVPPDAPEIREKSVTMSSAVDTDHAGCCITWRSHSRAQLRAAPLAASLLPRGLQLT